MKTPTNGKMIFSVDFNDELKEINLYDNNHNTIARMEILLYDKINKQITCNIYYKDNNDAELMKINLDKKDNYDNIIKELIEVFELYSML